MKTFKSLALVVAILSTVCLEGCSSLLKAQTGSNQIATATAVFECAVGVAQSVNDQLAKNPSCQQK